MRPPLFALLSLALLASPVAAAPAQVQLVDLKPADGKLPELLRLQAQRAAKLHLKPVAELSADWCKPCAAIKRYLSDPQMVEAFHEVLLIRLDIDQWPANTLQDAGLDASGVPFFFKLDASGHASGQKISSSVWGADIPANMAPPLKAFFAQK
jgi:thiol:disulfide interchange protein